MGIIIALALVVGVGGWLVIGDALTAGTTTITASAPGFNSVNAGNATPQVDMTVNAPAMTLDNINQFNDVGSSLQAAGRISLDGGQHGGITVTLTSSDPSEAIVPASVTIPAGTSTSIISAAVVYRTCKTSSPRD